MTKALIWLHNEALRANHPVFAAAPPATEAVYIWDDAYFRAAEFSLKRLVFIYETLCALPVSIIAGDTRTILQELAPATLYIPAASQQSIQSIMADLSDALKVEIIADERFVKKDMPLDAQRFFKFWKKIEGSALQKNGGDSSNAKRS